MATEPIVLINVLKVEPDKQTMLINLLKQNIETVISTLSGWRTSQLIAAQDGTSIIIYSEWDTPAAIEAMHAEPRMTVYFSKISELAHFDSIMGSHVLCETSEGEQIHPFESHHLQRVSPMARMVVIYNSPKDIVAFDQHYFDIHVPLAKKIPGLRKYEVSNSIIATPIGATNVHRIGILYFDNLAAIETAFASAEGQAAGADRRLFAPDDSEVQMFLFDSKEV